MSAQRGSILCIEDDLETAAMIAEELAERGFVVRVAHDGKTGLSMILDAPPDLILADVNMPGLSGFDVLEQLAGGEERYKRIPFVFLTALADRDNELKGWRLGADDYVTKPVDFDVLEAVLAARLKSSAVPKALPVDLQGLHERELEVLTWAARGKTSAEISQILGIVKRTVDFHLDNARSKLKVANRSQAIALATARRLIEP